MTLDEAIDKARRKAIEFDGYAKEQRELAGLLTELRERKKAEKAASVLTGEEMIKRLGPIKPCDDEPSFCERCSYLDKDSDCWLWGKHVADPLHNFCEQFRHNSEKYPLVGPLSPVKQKTCGDCVRHYDLPDCMGRASNAEPCNEFESRKSASW